MQSTRTARYFDVLTLPRIPATFGAALIGRGAYALVFLPLFGGTLAAIGLSALFAPHGAVLIVLAAVAGVFAPPLGPTMRVAWGRLTPTSELLKKALSFDAVVEELLYLGGPAAMGIALAFIAPGTALLVPAGLVLVGGLLFSVSQAVGDMNPQARVVERSRRDRPLVLDPRFVGVLIPTLVAGAVSGSISVSVPVVVSDAGGPAAAGIALGIFAGGSAVGGLIFGALRVPGSPIRQLLALTAALVTISSLVALATGAVSVTIVLAAAGLFFSPVMIVAYFAAHRAGGEYRQNSATTWVNTSHNIGASLGSALAGVVIQAAGVPAATIGIASGAAVLLVASAVLGRGRTATRR